MVELDLLGLLVQLVSMAQRVPQDHQALSVTMGPRVLRGQVQPVLLVLPAPRVQRGRRELLALEQRVPLARRVLREILGRLVLVRQALRVQLVHRDLMV